jgi:threonine dehydratase
VLEFAGQAFLGRGVETGADRPAVKLERIHALGAGLVLVDGDYDVACERAAAISEERGIRRIEDSVDVETCDGAATIGLELAAVAGRFDAVLVAPGAGSGSRGL